MPKKKSSLLEHCKRCSKIVSTWPQWKKKSIQQQLDYIHNTQETEAQYQSRRGAIRAYDYWPGD